MSKPVEVTVGNHKINHRDFSSPNLFGTTPFFATGWATSLDDVFSDDKKLREFLTTTRAGTGLLNNMVADIKEAKHGEVTSISIEQAITLLKDQRKHQLDVQEKHGKYHEERSWSDLKGMPSAVEWALREGNRLVDKWAGPSTGNTTVYGPGVTTVRSPDGSEKPAPEAPPPKDWKGSAQITTNKLEAIKP